MNKNIDRGPIDVFDLGEWSQRLKSRLWSLRLVVRPSTLPTVAGQALRGRLLDRRGEADAISGLPSAERTPLAKMRACKLYGNAV